MKKRFDILLAVLLVVGVTAVLIAWWALMHAWGYL